MKASRLLGCSLMLVCAASLLSAQSLVTVYSHNFESPVDHEWSDWSRETTPVGHRTFLGRFSDEPVSLDLYNLGDHCSVTVSFELFIMDSWEGSVGYDAGPDIWDLNASTPSDCCPEVNLLHTTFANCSCRYQAYPDNYPHVHHPGLTGADEVDTLGYPHDSVYYMSFTFFHNNDDLRLTFAGSSMLQGVTDEYWGIDNIVVKMDTSGRNCCRATRHLPDGFSSGVPVEVTLDVTPNPYSEVHVIEETTPMGWVISHVNDGGVWDQSTRVIKWGPFFDDVGRVLSYTATSGPASTATAAFNGVITVDGETEPICGDKALALGAYHPADVDEDWMIDAEEFTTYGAAWKNGDGWAVGPNPIPADYVTVAGVIWKSGEAYVFDGSLSPPWTPSGGKTLVWGSATGSFSDAHYRPGQELTVSLLVEPEEGSLAYSVVDTPPPGWQVGSVANNGRWDATSHSVKWGPFFSDAPQSLSYTVRVPRDAAGEVSFLGEASFNGNNVLVEGARTIDSAGERPEESVPSSIQ